MARLSRRGAIAASRPTGGGGGAADALQRRVAAELGVFTGWLTANSAQGFIGEVGWPNTESPASWNDAGEVWYDAADTAGLWVAYWATGEWWNTTYLLAAYEDSGGAAGVDSTEDQAVILEAHPTTGSPPSSGSWRGINVAGADFGSTFPGTYDTDYHYDGQATFDYLFGRGVRLIRLPFKWERVQQTLGAALNSAELTRLTDCVNRAGSAGLKVILDVHNYARYKIGGTEHAIGGGTLTQAHLTDLWTRLCAAFKANTNVTGYGLMNEPHDLAGGAGGWETISQAALDAIRTEEGAGAHKTVLVPGYAWSGAQQWSSSHADGWITDSAASFRYEAHHYFDDDNSGTYPSTYAQEVTNAAGQGF